MKDVFIDTNVYCGFYEGQKVRLEVLTALLELIKAKKIRLLLPAQVKDEFYKNRSHVASRAVKQIEILKKEIKKASLPACVMGAEDFKEFERVCASLGKICDQFPKKFSKHVLDESSNINKTIEAVFGAAIVQDINREILKKAKDRIFRGMPPGKKNGGNGDEINWEALLASDSKNLIIVSYDGDWCDDLAENELNYFLRDEWKCLKEGAVELQTNLAELINRIAGRQKIEKAIVKSEDEIKNSYKTYVTGYSGFPVSAYALAAGYSGSAMGLPPLNHIPGLYSSAFQLSQVNREREGDRGPSSGRP